METYSACMLNDCSIFIVLCIKWVWQFRELGRYMLCTVYDTATQCLYCREYLMIFRDRGFLAIILCCSSPPSPHQIVSLFKSSCVSPVELTDRRREGGRVWGRSQIIRCRVNPVLYKSFNTLCSTTLLLTPG